MNCVILDWNWRYDYKFMVFNRDREKNKDANVCADPSA